MELQVRKGLVEFLLGQVVRAAATAAVLGTDGSVGRPSPDCISLQEQILGQGAAALGQEGQLAPSVLRRELLERGRRDLVRRTGKIQKGRNAAAQRSGIGWSQGP